MSESTAPRGASQPAGWLVLVLALFARPGLAQDPCLECDVMYAGDCAGGLWGIDTSAGTSWYVGALATTMFDVAVTWDGILVGVSSGGQLYEISACDGTSTLLPATAAGLNGLAGDLVSVELFAQGPPLALVDPHAALPAVPIGGSVGPAPPAWCGSSSGDLALHPETDVLLATLGCARCAGADLLVELDPATGDVLREVGCVRSAGGIGHAGVYGLAFDSAGVLWGSRGARVPSLLRIDPDTAVAEEVPIAGGYDCGYGLASVPCSRPFLPCAEWDPPASVGPALRITGHGDPRDPEPWVDLDWSTDRGAPRPASEHYHVLRGKDPRHLPRLTAIEPHVETRLRDAAPSARTLPAVHHYLVLAANDCEDVSLD